MYQDKFSNKIEECDHTQICRTHPCPKLQAPKNGLVACNGWQTEYATMCKYYCYDGFALPPGFTAQHIVNCGATGMWSPSTQLRECILK
ncbi:hypothetical protein MAR_021873, partial [Mya arenaria]